MASMRIAIVGSVDPGRRDYDHPIRHADEAEAACETLGRALADAGHRLIVYSAEPAFCERPVVRGYVTSKQVQTRRQMIDVTFPADQPRAAEFPERKTHPNLFRLRAAGSSEWEIAFYQSLRDADAVILIGGGRSTLITGVVAKAFEKPVLALSYFGGSAETIWKSLVAERDLPAADAIEDMAARPDEALARRLVASLKSQARECRRISRRRTGIVYAIVSVVLLVAWILTLPLGYIILYDGEPEGGVRESMAFVFLLFLAPVLAGISGATIRMARPHGSEPASISTVLGAGAGAAAGLLYVASQLVGGASLYNFAWLLFAAIFGFVGGLTFDRVFQRLERADVARTETLAP